MHKKQFVLNKHFLFTPQLQITPDNFDHFSKHLKITEDVKVELKRLSDHDERFVLSALCGYQRFYPQRKVEIKCGGGFYQLKAIPPLKSLHIPRFFLNLQLTSRCNFNCRHCYNQLKNRHLKQPYLSLKTLETICRQFLTIERAKDFKHISVYLLGGEPFLHPELPAIIEMLAGLKVNGVYFNDVRLGSNGVLIPKNIGLLKHARDLFDHFSVQISVDGDAGIYQQIRGKSIDIPLRALKTLKANKIKRQIACSISRTNKFCIEYILKLCDKYEAAPHITPYVPFNEDLEVLTRSEWETFKLALTGMLRRRYVGACGYDWGCGIGWNGTSIDPEGYIIGCPRDPEVVGHIDNISLVDQRLWRTKAEGPFLFYNRCGKFIKNDIQEKRPSLIFPVDITKNTPHLQITRDKITSKTIYYYNSTEGLIYGTNLKMVLNKMPGIKPDPVGIHNFITFGYLPFERTLIKDLYKLEPGQTLTWDKERGIKIDNNWKYPYDEIGTESKEFYNRQIQLLIEDFLRTLIRDKTPDKLAVMLSGGIDSSFIAAIFKKITADKIRTVTVTCDGWTEDAIFARTIARRLGTEHKEINLSPKEVVQTLDNIIGKLDLPTSNQRIFIRKYQDDNPNFVLLTGMGADEIFLGWPQYQQILKENNSRNVSLLPRFINQNIPGSIEMLLKGHLFNDSEKKLLLTENAFNEARNYFTNQPWAPYTQYQNTEEGIRVLQAFYLQHRLPNWQLIWAGFENIHPYLDQRMIELTLRIPLKYKINNGTEKYILRKSAESYLPEQVINRTDTHSSLPLEMWFEHGLKEKARRYIMDSYLVEQGIFNRKYIESLLSSNDNRGLTKIYLLTVLEIWFRGHQ